MASNKQVAICLSIRCLPVWAALVAGAAAAADPQIGPDRYRFEFSASFEKGGDTARARIHLLHEKRRVRELSLHLPAPKYTQLIADGDLHEQDGRWIWKPPREGGTLSYNVIVASMRGGQADAMITDDWVIMRLEDLFPSARARAVKSADGDGLLKLNGPATWSFETAYGDVAGKWKSVQRTGRIYPQPKGWMIGGKLGIRRQLIADRRVVIAAPKAAGLRRMEALTFLRWTLPTVTSVFDVFPDRLLIVGAPRPMWRGAISAPGSLYLHADRPLVSENGTSTLMHELIHVAGVQGAAPGADWIVEGLAEYYALEMLVRSRGLTSSREKRVLRELQAWVERDHGVLADPSKGVDTARAALLFASLDAELRAADTSLDAVARQLVAGGISAAALRAAARKALGRESEVLARELAGHHP